MHNSDLIVFTAIPFGAALFMLLISRIFKRTKHFKMVKAANAIIIILLILAMVVGLGAKTINKEYKFPLKDSLAEYLIHCRGYYQLEYQTSVGSKFIVIGTAPDNLNDFCDERLVRVEGRIGPFYGAPICDNSENIEKCEKALIPVVHLTKIESLTNPPTYMEE